MKRYTVLLIVLGMLAGLIPQSVYAAEAILVEAESFTGYLDAYGGGIEYTNGSTKNALVIREGEYSEYTVNVKYPGTYKIVALTSVESSRNKTFGPYVLINGEQVLAANSVLFEGKGLENYLESELGTFSFSAGNNTVRIGLITQGGSRAFFFDYFELIPQKVDEGSSGAEAVTVEGESYTGYADASGGDVERTNVGVVVREGEYTEYTVDIIGGMYEIVMYAGIEYTRNGTFGPYVKINGEEVLAANSIMLKTDGNYTYTDMPLGVYEFKDGINTVRIGLISQGGGRAYLLDYFRLIPVGGSTEAEFAVSDFGLTNSIGDRPAMAISEGQKAWVKAVLTSSGKGEKADVYIAEYDTQGRLVKAEANRFDTAQMSAGEEKAFFADMIMTGSGAKIKAFIMKEGTITPLSVSSSFTDAGYEQLFKSIMNKEVAVTPAAELLNTEGEYYAEYGVHDSQYDIDAVFYDGSIYNGVQTKTFAYIGIPKGASEESPVPAVVLIHGGWGRAELSWVKSWNDRGYAAIAMDLYGNGPETDADNADHTGMKRTPYAGIYPWDDGTNTAFNRNYEDAGMYHNVVNVICAHNILRQDPRVDKTKIGVTGISWGGITATTVCGADSRFAFAVPIYGCGYLDQSRTYMQNSYNDECDDINWDPANFAAKARMPVLLVNGDSDPHFSINATTSTAAVLADARLSIQRGLEHKQQVGDKVKEVYDFADSIVNGTGFSRAWVSEIADGKVRIGFDGEGASAASARLYYIKDSEIPYGGNVSWVTISSYTEEDGEIVFSVPSAATWCYAAVTDSRGDIVSTGLVSLKY